jgi:hypothetical protein
MTTEVLRSNPVVLSAWDWLYEPLARQLHIIQLVVPGSKAWPAWETAWKPRSPKRYFNMGCKTYFGFVCGKRAGMCITGAEKKHKHEEENLCRES